MKIIFLILLLVSISCQDKSNNDEKHIVKKYVYGYLKEEYQINSDSIKNGFYYIYDTDGNIEEKLNYENDELMGEQYFYKENNLTKYAVVDGFGDVIYVLRYNEMGAIVQEDGMVVSPNVYCPKCDKNNSVNVHDTILFNGMISKPPGKSIKVKLKVISPSGKAKYKSLKIYKNNIISFQEIFAEKGVYKIIIIGVLNQNDCIHSSDTIRKEILVK